MTSYDVDRLPDRFRAKTYVNGITGCWEWQGAHTSHGYGEIRFGGQTLALHRFAYELYVAPIPRRHHLDHLCRRRDCINPAHLDPVSAAENARRGIHGGMQAALPREHTSGDAFLLDALSVIAASENAVWSEDLATRLAALRPDRYDGWDKYAVGEAMRRSGVPIVQIARGVEGRQQNRRGVRRQAVEDAAIRNRPGQVA